MSTCRPREAPAHGRWAAVSGFPPTTLTPLSRIAWSTRRSTGRKPRMLPKLRNKFELPTKDLDNRLPGPSDPVGHAIHVLASFVTAQYRHVSVTHHWPKAVLQ